MPDKTADGELYDIPCASTLSGSSIRVTSVKRKYLHMAGVEVFGPVEKCDPVGLSGPERR